MPILLGPTSPRDVADLLEGRDRTIALTIPGYRGTAVSELARALVSAGEYVELATLSQDVDQILSLDGERFRLHIAPMRPRARSRAKDMFRVERRHLGEFIRRRETEPIHAHWTYEFAWAALDGDAPTIITARDAPLTILKHFRDRYRAVRATMAWLIRFRIDHLTVPSPYLATAWRRQMFYHRSISVIPNVVRLPPHSDQRTVGFDTTAPIILEVADASPNKNVAAIVTAMRGIVSSHPSARLRLAGPGLTHGSHLAQLARRLRVHRSVDFLGVLDREQIAEEHRKANLFVHTSLEESFGNTVAEAMSHGLPVIAGSNAGAVPWLLDGGRVGILTDVRRPAGIATSVSTLLDDRSRQSMLGKSARARVERMFSPSRIATQWLEAYERVVGKT